jgi:hypothetical protein
MGEGPRGDIAVMPAKAGIPLKAQSWAPAFAGVTGLEVGGADQKAVSSAFLNFSAHPGAGPNSTRSPSVATEGEGRAQAPAAGMGGDGFTMSISSRHVRIHSYSILGKKSRP